MNPYDWFKERAWPIAKEIPGQFPAGAAEGGEWLNKMALTYPKLLFYHTPKTMAEMAIAAIDPEWTKEQELLAMQEQAIETPTRTTGKTREEIQAEATRRFAERTKPRKIPSRTAATAGGPQGWGKLIKELWRYLTAENADLETPIPTDDSRLRWERGTNVPTDPATGRPLTSTVRGREAAPTPGFGPSATPVDVTAPQTAGPIHDWSRVANPEGFEAYWREKERRDRAYMQQEQKRLGLPEDMAKQAIMSELELSGLKKRQEIEEDIRNRRFSAVDQRIDQQTERDVAQARADPRFRKAPKEQQDMAIKSIRDAAEQQKIMIRLSSLGIRMTGKYPTEEGFPGG